MEIVYLRAGDLPEGKKSLNHFTKELESGVSVWEALKLKDGTYRLIMPLVTRKTWEYAACDLHGVYGRPIYLVTGKVLKERGSIGEPLIKDPVLGEQVKLVVGRPWIVHPYKGKLPDAEIARLNHQYDEIYGPEEVPFYVEPEVTGHADENAEEDAATVTDAVIKQVRALITKDFIDDRQIDRIRLMVTQELKDEMKEPFTASVFIQAFPKRFAEALLMAVQNKLAESVAA